VSRVFRAVVSIGILFLSLPSFATQPLPLPPDPIYMFVGDGWKGFFARNNEFLEYSVIGKEVKPQDPYHIQVQAEPFLGIFVTFADRKQFGSGKSILDAHRQWEIEYWKERAKTVETKDRSDLASATRSVLVTEFSVWGHEPDQFMNMYMVAVPSNDGVYVFSISPTKNAKDEFVKSFIGTIKLVNERFDVLKENKKIRDEVGVDKKQ
jgi:hypothetical protein